MIGTTMRIGYMNDPRLNACKEAEWAAQNGFEFLDLTIEGPGAWLNRLDVAGLKHILETNGLSVVGHTAWYLPFSSPVIRVRQAAIDTVIETFEAFAELGAKWVNVHVAPGTGAFSRKQMVQWNGESFATLAEQAAAYNIRIMVEPIPHLDLRVKELRSMLDRHEHLGFHLDVGHAYIGNGDPIELFLKAFAHRMPHVHFSDNGGRADDHLPLGAGRINWKKVIRLLKQHGYNDTITLEVFSKDRDYLLMSAKKVREWWDRIPPPPPPPSQDDHADNDNQVDDTKHGESVEHRSSIDDGTTE